MAGGNYGATGNSFVLHDDPEGEDEFDYLPIPEGYEDQGSNGGTPRSPGLKRIPFSSIHKSPLPFDSHDRQCFMPGHEILVKITDIDQSDHTKILNPYLYVVQINHGEYEWTVKRRYKHFRSLHDSLYLFKLQTAIPMPTKEARDRRKHFAKTKDLTKFPKRPEPLVRSENLDERKHLLQEYLQSVLRCPLYLHHPETLKFLEVSHLSFINGLGVKHKEGMVEKRAGGRRIALHCCSCWTCCQPGQWQEREIGLFIKHRYLAVKDTFVALLRPGDGTISDVLLMDRDFSVKYGLLSTGTNHGLLISNLSRHLLVKCWTQRKAHEWYDDIEKAIEKTGQDYTKPNRFDSFVPMRPNSYVNWFVDGASYMAAVADALESAKEEIFITDWMLSPELHLKRPALEGNRFRLDVILERKAKEGVKVFILVYKEMEMALGINSFYTKHALTSKDENIKVMRHPDGIKLWSHHEKCVVIDQRLAFLGGIDLCYGRWDTRKHRLTDLGSLTLTNIFGVQDSETLDNLLHNVPNIVPKKESLISPGEDAGGLSLLLQSVAERPSRLESIREVDQSQVEVSLPNGRNDGTRASTDSNESDKSGHRKSNRSSRSPKNGKNTEGYVNPCLVNDSPSSHVAPSMETPTGEGSAGQSEDYSSKTKYSVFGRDVASDLPPESRANGGDSSAVNNQNGTNVLSPAISELSLNQGTTLQTFLRNLAEKDADVATALRPDPMTSSTVSLEALDLHHQSNGVEKQRRTPSFLQFGRRQSYNVEPSDANSARKDRPKDLFIATGRDASDGLTAKQLAKVFGPTSGDKAEAKPVTPVAKRKLKWKTVVDTKIMFQKQLSVDVSSDDPNRPWDERVFHAKECDVIDGEIDARLQTRQQSKESLKIWVGKDYVNFIFKDFVELDKPFTDMVDRTVTPRMPWHDIGVAVFGKPARDVARHFIQRWNFTKLQKRKTNTGIPMLVPKSSTKVPVPKWAISSAFCCNAQILRSACEWSAGIKLVEDSIHNAYTDLIMEAQHYIYIENQFFITMTKDKIVENQIAVSLYERILKAHRSGQTFRVYVILPLLPAFEGQLGTSTGTSIQAVIHWNYSSICRGGNSLLERLVKAGVHDPFEYISFYGLRKHEKMIGKLMTELVYVHSKLMIVDDFSVIIGSANINDRSLLGYRDSELAVLVQDTSHVDSFMNGKPYKAGAFACSLRKSLFREHLGVEKDDRSINVSDPIISGFYKNIWLKQASINTTVYEKVFNCVPTDSVLTLQQLRDHDKKPKLVDTNLDAAKAHLERVKGHLVLLPLQFLLNETLTPAAGTKEALAPTVIWT